MNNSIIARILNGMLGEEHQIEEKKVFKDNEEVNAIIISREMKGNRIGQVFYPNYYDGTDEEVSEIIYNTYINNIEGQHSINDTIGNLDRNGILERVKPVVLNKELNIKLLDDVYYREMLDLVIVVRCFYDDFSFVVNKGSCAHYNITEDELFDNAIKNNGTDFDIASMTSIIEDYIDESEKDNHSQMYVATTKNKNYGAYIIADYDMLEKISDEIMSDLIVLPSSIHEVIILPEKNNQNKIEELRDLVKFVNETSLEKNEVLSYNVYKFTRGQGLTIA